MRLRRRDARGAASFRSAAGTNEGDVGLIPGLGRSPGEGNGYPRQYSCLENPMLIILIIHVFFSLF